MGKKKRALSLFILLGTISFLSSCSEPLIEIRTVGPNKLENYIPKINIKQKEQTAPNTNSINSQPLQNNEIPQSLSRKILIKPVDAKPVLEKDRVYFYTNCGSYVRAVDNGRVLFASDSLKSYGYMVIVKDQSGYLSVYTYMQKIYVNKGDEVKRGAIIGEVGVNPSNGRCMLMYQTRNSKGDLIRPIL